MQICSIELMYTLFQYRLRAAASCGSPALSVDRPHSAPAARFVDDGSLMASQHWFDHRSGSLKCILSPEESTITGHDVFKEPFVGCFLSWVFSFDQIEFLLANLGLDRPKG